MKTYTNANFKIKLKNAFVLFVFICFAFHLETKNAFAFQELDQPNHENTLFSPNDHNTSGPEAQQENWAPPDSNESSKSDDEALGPEGKSPEILGFDYIKVQELGQGLSLQIGIGYSNIQEIILKNKTNTASTIGTLQGANLDIKLLYPIHLTRFNTVNYSLLLGGGMRYFYGTGSLVEAVHSGPVIGPGGYVGTKTSRVATQLHTLSVEANAGIKVDLISMAYVVVLANGGYGLLNSMSFNPTIDSSAKEGNRSAPNVSDYYYGGTIGWFFNVTELLSLGATGTYNTHVMTFQMDSNNPIYQYDSSTSYSEYSANLVFAFNL